MEKIKYSFDEQYTTNQNQEQSDSDFQIAIQLITNRFSKINDELKSKNKKLIENETLFETLHEEIRLIKEENNQLFNENRHLNELNKKLKEENNNLIKFKTNIVNSLKNEDFNSDFNTKSYLITTENDIDDYAKRRDKEYESYNNHLHIPLEKFKASPSQYNVRNRPTYENSINYINTFKYSKENSHTTENAEDIINKIKDKYNNTQLNVENSTGNKGISKIDGRISELKERLKTINKDGNNMDTLSRQSYFYKPFNLKYTERIDKYTKNTEKEFHNSHNLDNKSKQYVLSLKFFNNCRLLLDNKNYQELIYILIDKNKNNASDEEVYKRIKKILGSHTELVNDFEEIFRYLGEDVYNYLKTT